LLESEELLVHDLQGIALGAAEKRQLLKLVEVLLWKALPASSENLLLGQNKHKQNIQDQ
jgi:hypothetical protein